MGFNKRKWWHFGNRSIAIEIAGWKSHPSIYLKVDGDERDICFHLALGFGIWISFERFLPKSWYPTYESEYGHGRLPDEREISIAFHGGYLWWNFWVSEEWSSYTKNKTWRKGCWRIKNWIMGKHKCDRVEIDRLNYILPFIEGNYNVEVIKSERIDTWERWPTKKSIAWEVKAGYYKEGKFIAKAIPIEGKGENGWDCDEDGTYSIYFPGPPYRKELKTHYDAALYFWQSVMKDRERRGSARWVPKEFSNQHIKTIK